MREMNVNLLDKEKAVTRPRRSGASAVKFFISPLLVAIVFAASFGMGRLSLTGTASAALAPLADIPIMKHLVGSPDRKLIGEAEDRINVLLVGVGGEGHEGPNLTDTLMVASIRPSDNAIALLSIPRDLLVPVEGHGWRKINSVNAFAEAANPGSGGAAVRKAVEGLLGIDVPYYVRIDFEGFREIIDATGGVDVHVDRSFTDYTYPTYQYGIQKVSFEEGWQHLNGEQALQFARSRHGTNGEGSDFARARRQQKVISALKEKLTSVKTYRNPVTITNMLGALQSNISTNLHLGEMLRLAAMGQNADPAGIRHAVLDNSPDGVLVDSVVNGAYVLLPKGSDWTLLRNVAANVFQDAELAPQDERTPPPAAQPDAEKPTVEIQNGNGTSGIARDMAQLLQKLGFEVVKIGNADNFDYDTTLMFDLTGGEKPDSLKSLTGALDRAEVRDASEATRHDPSSSADFLIIIGKQ